MKSTKLFAVLAAVAVPLALFSSSKAVAGPVLYTISSSATNANAGPGALNPGTLSGSFYYDPTNLAFSGGSLTIAGVQSCDLNGNYSVFTGGGDSTDLQIQGITTNNSCGQSNTSTFLDINFASSLGMTSDSIASIYNIGGNTAYFSTPPTVAYADPTRSSVPEPSSVVLMASALLMLGAASVMRRRTSRQDI